jgi:hypothetical protein
LAFINEYMSAADAEKYGIAAINMRYIVNGTSARDWTIDKERSIYLRHVAWGPRERELFHQRVWTLFWEGELIEIGLDNLESTGGPHQPCWSHVKVRCMKLPPQFEHRRDEVIECLREALLAHKDGGVFGTATEFSLTLDV